MTDTGQFSQLVNKIGIGILQANFVIQFNTSGGNALAFQGQLIDFAGYKRVGHFFIGKQAL